LFKLPLPASRSTIPTGYGYVLPDQNGWSRHFQSAWVAVLTGLLYICTMKMYVVFVFHYERQDGFGRSALGYQTRNERS
jgi:hypothetical protein